MPLLKRASKLSFTLLEVVVCISLLAVLAGAIAYKGHDLLQHYLLRSSAKTVVREIEAAQILALSYQTDICLKVVKEKGDYFLKWETDEPFLEERCRPQKLRGIKNAKVDYKSRKTATVAGFSSASSWGCSSIDFVGKGNEGCRIELVQGRPLAIKNTHFEETE